MSKSSILFIGMDLLKETTSIVWCQNEVTHYEKIGTQRYAIDTLIRHLQSKGITRFTLCMSQTNTLLAVLLSSEERKPLLCNSSIVDSKEIR